MAKAQNKQITTWYVLSKLSYINLVISDVFPTSHTNAHTPSIIIYLP